MTWMKILKELATGILFELFYGTFPAGLPNFWCWLQFEMQTSSEGEVSGNPLSVNI